MVDMQALGAVGLKDVITVPSTELELWLKEVFCAAPMILFGL